MSEDILNKHDRSAACSGLNELGYQHIHRHKMLDTEVLSDATIESLFSTEDFLSEPDEKKRKTTVDELKTCQLKIYFDVKRTLTHHDGNFTLSSFTRTKLEILILCPLNSDRICQKLASHLGLIFLEDLNKLVEKNVKNKELFLNTGKKMQNYIPSSKTTLEDVCLLYTSPSPRDRTRSRMPSSA